MSLMTASEFVVSWPQLVHESVEMPMICGGCGGCARVDRVSPGEPLILELFMTTTLVCTGMDGCSCTPDAGGACEIADGIAEVPPAQAFMISFDGANIDVKLSP